MTAGDAAAAERAVAMFARAHGVPPTHLARAPARVNLIGEHTDYNDGFCLPVAIDLELCIALRPTGEPRIRLVSEQDPVPAEVRLPPPDARSATAWREPGAPGRPAAMDWSAYVEGMAVMLASAGPLTGWDGVLASDIPVGAGLSSSAALELAVAVGTLAMASAPLGDRPAGGIGVAELARLAQRAENEWVGVSTGLLDQLACAGGVPGHALLLDCRTARLDPVPLPERCAVVVLDTGTRRRVATTAYADRRADCERAARALGVPALRDLHPTLPAHASGRLDPRTLARSRHVIGENRRVLAVADALRAGDPVTAGALLTEGHRSLRDDFEVSGPELDAAVAAAVAAPGCFGARMTGGGFAGCAVALVDRSSLDRFRPAAMSAYRSRTGRPLRVFTCSAVAGAHTTRLP